MKLKIAPIVALLALTGGGALADEDTTPEIVATVTADLNGDGAPDRADLIGRDDDVDLAIYISVGGKLPAQPTLLKSALGWQGALDGTEPAISVNARGSLVIEFQNDSVGRDRWHEQLTLAFRGGKFLVAGYGYSYRDTIDPKAGGSCDINLLTGQGTATVKGKSAQQKISLPPKPIAIEDWNDASIPKPCRPD